MGTTKKAEMSKYVRQHMKHTQRKLVHIKQVFSKGTTHWHFLTLSIRKLILIVKWEMGSQQKWAEGQSDYEQIFQLPLYDIELNALKG